MTNLTIETPKAIQSDESNPFASVCDGIPIPESREAWLELRRAGIGGSDAAALLGKSKRSGPFSVFESKIMPVQIQEEAGESEFAYWGHRLEDVVAQEFAKRIQLEVRPSKVMFRNKQRPWMLATVDRLAIDPELGEISLLECKTRANWVKQQWDEGVPEDIQCQCDHYLAVTGAPRIWVAVLIGGNTFRIELVDRDEDRITHLIKIEERFWRDHILTMEPPPLDASPASRDLIEAKYPSALPGKTVELSILGQKALRTIHESRLTKSGIDDGVEAAKLQLKAELGDAEIGTLLGEPVVTWKQARRSTVDTTRLKTRYPIVYKDVIRESGSRTLRIAGASDE